MLVSDPPKTETVVCAFFSEKADFRETEPQADLKLGYQPCGRLLLTAPNSAELLGSRSQERLGGSWASAGEGWERRLLEPAWGCCLPVMGVGSREHPGLEQQTLPLTLRETVVPPWGPPTRAQAGCWQKGVIKLRPLPLQPGVFPGAISSRSRPGVGEWQRDSQGPRPGVVGAFFVPS